jgi:hypothetical protein
MATGGAMLFTFKFFRIRLSDGAHATLDRVSQEAPDIEAAKVKSKSLFEILNMPQKPDGVRILDEGGTELLAWKPGDL